MLAQDFQPVGRDFPVFLHPRTHEEYALARTERKQGRGYHGFTTWSAPEVTLEQDLQRRDLTINAIAQDPQTSELVDPYGGRADIESRLLRHVSPAFVEDPLRVLRVARFAARFAPLHFQVAAETMQLMSAMAASGELSTLTPERVWRETQLALVAPAPQRYLQVLRDCGALKVILPEIDVLFGVPQPARWHPEIDTGVHMLMVMEQAARISDDPVARFGALMHDLGKGTTPPEIWPRHIGHEARGVPLVHAVCDRWRVPNEYREVAVMTAEHHGKLHNIGEMRSETLLALLEKLDALRRPERFRQFMLACEADMRGRTGFENHHYSQAEFLERVRDAVSDIRPDAAMIEKYSGQKMAARLRELRVDAIERLPRPAMQ
jgi:tRNA nucleotidyltransferase (CCA-adding enzyme)